MSDFPHDNEAPIGETDEMAEEEKAYAASDGETSQKDSTQEGSTREDSPRGKSPSGDDHALGGSQGTTDGT